MPDEMNTNENSGIAFALLSRPTSLCQRGQETVGGRYLHHPAVLNSPSSVIPSLWFLEIGRHDDSTCVALSRFVFLLGWGIGATSVVNGDEPAEEKKDRVMLVDVTIRRPDGDMRRFRKPYVAVWLQDKDKFPVRTLALWVQKTQPGPRWYPDLRVWYRDEKLREVVDGNQVIDAISGATRGPGTYKFAWDGLDERGKPVKPGTYTLVVESAREHGTYQIMKDTIELGAEPIKKSLPGNVEIESVNFTYSGKLPTP